MDHDEGLGQWHRSVSRSSAISIPHIPRSRGSNPKLTCWRQPVVSAPCTKQDGWMGGTIEDRRCRGRGQAHPRLNGGVRFDRCFELCGIDPRSGGRRKENNEIFECQKEKDQNQSKARQVVPDVAQEGAEGSGAGGVLWVGDECHALYFIAGLQDIQVLDLARREGQEGQEGLINYDIHCISLGRGAALIGQFAGINQ